MIPEKENDIFCVKEDQQGSFCVQLIVSVKDYEGNIKISWPEGLIPDSTQAVFEDVKTRTEDLYEAGADFVDETLYVPDLSLLKQIQRPTIPGIRS